MSKQTGREVDRATRKLFWRAVTSNKRLFILTSILHAPFFFINNVFIPLQVAYGLESIFERRFDDTVNIGLFIVGLSVASNIIMGFATWAFNRQGILSAAYVVREAFGNYLDKDYEFFANNYVGSLGAQVASLREATTAYEKMVFFDVPRVLTVIVAGVTVLAFQSPVLALITLTCIVLIMGVTLQIGRMRLKYRREVSKASSALAGVLGDALSHGATVKSFANEAYESKRLDHAITSWSRAQLKSWDLFTPANGTRNILLAIATALLLVVSARFYEQGTISIATIALVQIYVIKLINTSIDIGEIVKAYDALMGMAHAPVATMLARRAVTDPTMPKAFPQAFSLNLDNVTYRYPDAGEDKTAVKAISLRVREGEKIGIVGYSGSGKTTLSKLLLRFMDVDDGAIRIDGIDIRELAQQELRKHVAYVPQEPLLFHRSIKENIAYANPEASDEAVLRAAKMAYVDEFVAELPQGYDTQVGERGVKLSGGQRQRVAIARAILKDAPVLVMDEATSALDSQSEHFIQQALWRLMKKRTVVVIAHRLSTIQRMDRIVVMDNGSIVEVGTHAELLRNESGIYAKLWAHQSDGYIGIPDKDTTSAED